MELTQILYVEDDPDIQAVAQMSLEAIGGFSVRLCSSGEEALAMLKKERPQLILLDVMMPGMDGPSTFRAIRGTEEGEFIPIIFITAKAQASELHQLIELGAIGTISKPFDPMMLPDQVRGLWKQFLAKHEAKIG